MSAPKKAKQPQDRREKALQQVRTEARKLPELSELVGRKVVIGGRRGPVTVTIMADPLDWDAQVDSFLREGDYFSAISGMVVEKDAEMLRVAHPTIGDILMALMEPDPETGEASPGESQAS